MPRLGEPVEPSRVDQATPWWRLAEGLEVLTKPQPVEPQPRDETPEIDATVQWPID